MVLFGQPGIARDDPDFIPAFVMDHILGGGGFGSRLIEEVREKRGLTYGVSTWLGSGGLRLALHGRLLQRQRPRRRGARHRARGMAADGGGGVTREELEAAKRYLTGAYPLRFDGNGRIAGQLLSVQAAGLDPGYVNERNALVEAVTVEDMAGSPGGCCGRRAHLRRRRAAGGGRAGRINH